MKPNLKIPYAFVDGSFNSKHNIYGFGGFLVYDGEQIEGSEPTEDLKHWKIILQGYGDDPDTALMRNVAGEICGATYAIMKAIELGLPEITIYYDYMGIEMWATGLWKRNKGGTIAYYDYIQSIKDIININFVHVKGHSGIEGNEEADKLAKEAVGLEEVDE